MSGQDWSVSGNVGRLVLPSGQTTLVDVADLEIVREYQWAFTPAASPLVTGYRIGYRTGLRVSMHRLLLNAPPEKDVVHLNRNTLDNRRRNLVLATRSESRSQAGVRSDNGSGYKGVHLHRDSGRWRAQITVDGVRRSLGLFTDPWDAAEAWNGEARKAWGQCAYQNVRKSP